MTGKSDASCRITLFGSKLVNLDHIAARALEMTAEQLKTDIIQAQVIPFYSVEEKGRRADIHPGWLQNEQTYVDRSDSSQGYVAIVSSTPYARRLYYHPEYKFSTGENPNAKAHWFEDWADGGIYGENAGEYFAAHYRREAGNAVK